MKDSSLPLWDWDAGEEKGPSRRVFGFWGRLTVRPGSGFVEVEVANPEGERWVKVKALLDGGSTYARLPKDLLLRLGVRPGFRKRFVTAGKGIARYDVAVVLIRLNGRVLPSLVVFGEDGSAPVLGAYTLMEFGMISDPAMRERR